MIRSQLDAEEFIKNCGSRLKEHEFYAVVKLLRDGVTPYKINHMDGMVDGRTATKIRDLFNDGKLEDYLEWRESGGNEAEKVYMKARERYVRSLGIQGTLKDFYDAVKTSTGGDRFRDITPIMKYP